MKPHVITQVTKKQIKAESWKTDGDEFSDEDLFADNDDPLFDEYDGKEKLALEATPVERTKATIPITLKKDLQLIHGSAPEVPPRPSIDFEALTFYS